MEDSAAVVTLGVEPMIAVRAKDMVHVPLIYLPIDPPSAFIAADRQLSRAASAKCLPSHAYPFLRIHLFPAMYTNKGVFHGLFSPYYRIGPEDLVSPGSIL